MIKARIRVEVAYSGFFMLRGMSSGYRLDFR
mgnify:CR=1 FL=1